MASAPDYSTSALIVVDMSVEQLGNVQYRRKEIIEATKALAAKPWKLKIDSRLWLYSPEESALSTNLEEWGRTMGIPGSEGAKLDPELAGLGLEFMEKKNYSCFFASGLEQRLKEAGIRQVVIVGINTEFCVFATSLDAYSLKYQLAVVEQAVSSRHGSAAHEEGLQRIKTWFGDNVVVNISQFV